MLPVAFNTPDNVLVPETVIVFEFVTTAEVSTAKVIVSVVASVVNTVPVPAARVSVSLPESATMLL